MNADEMWSQLCERHPEFKNDDYVLAQKARGLRRLIEQAYENGREDGRKETQNGNQLYNQLFGKGFKR
jgi:hypothetical protein